MGEGFDTRRAAFERIAHGQWHFSEILTGEPFVRFRAALDDPKLPRY
jgi:hypothetical protein